MNHDLLSVEERLHGLQNRPCLVPRPIGRESGSTKPMPPRPFLLSGRPFRFPLFWLRRTRSPDAHRGLELHRAQLLGVALVLLVGGIAGTAWLLSLLGWIR